ncbi:helix-turn-helix domain-containing protein [Flavobacterium soli]|uniref:helix-turn-helix domain-containing protein n=1 Tax=Flavobacterium soli TaxID=344881 RepID=UPI0012F9DDD6|nr:helix-turn-helix domain-containing protein [Flavobacterium soli]
MKRLLLTAHLALFPLTIAYARHPPEADSLATMDYPELNRMVIEYRRDTVKARHIAQYWLSKASRERQPKEEANAYRAMMHLAEGRFRMIYADSLLEKANASRDDATIGSAYLTIGAAHYDNKSYTKALHAYLTANQHVAATNDAYLIHKVKYTIALTKYFLGYNDEAIALLTQCLAYFREENDMAYLKTLHAIGLCHTQTGRHDLSSYYNVLGMELATAYGIPSMVPYFKNSEGINHCMQQAYRTALPLLHASETELAKTRDHANQITTWAYLAKCYWELEAPQKGLEYGLRVHEGIRRHHYTRPDLRENYERLIAHYTELGNPEQQLFFIRELLAFDQHNTREFKHLSYKVHKEYDTRALLEREQAIERKLATDWHTYLAVVGTLGATLMAVTAWHLHTKRREKRRFRQVLAEFAEKEKMPLQKVKSPPAELSPELSQKLLKRLERFESQQKYLERDVNLAKLAALFNTNTKYVSLLIAHHRGKKVTAYLNDLKADHIVALLIEHHKYRNYTHNALAEEAGFGSTQIFTLSFKKRIGMAPIAFIQQLREAEAGMENEES